MCTIPSHSQSADASTSPLAVAQGSSAELERPLRLDDGEIRPYSIRVPLPAETVHCAICRLKFLASGPTGHVEDEPVCDECLLRGSKDLGMLLALSSITRSFGSIKGATRDEYSQALAELAAFARIYEQIAARSGPARYFKVSEVEN